MKFSRVFVDWGAVACYAAVIFWFSSLPPAHVPAPFPNSDKVFHVIEYVPLGWLLARALGCRSGKRRMLLLLIAYAGAYALSDEFHQRFVPGRSFSLFDMIADVTGAVLGGMVYLWRR